MHYSLANFMFFSAVHTKMYFIMKFYNNLVFHYSLNSCVSEFLKLQNVGFKILFKKELMEPKSKKSALGIDGTTKIN